jgi:hypothetical protein
VMDYNPKRLPGSGPEDQDGTFGRLALTRRSASPLPDVIEIDMLLFLGRIMS